MRLLHTADWHLGRSFHGESLLAAHAAVADHVATLAREARVDAVVLAGDLYDRAVAPADAVTLAGETLARLAEVCQVVLLPGNHDSAARLAFAAPLLERSRLHVRCDPGRCGMPVPVGDGLVFALPYLEPDLVRGVLGVDERSHAAVLGAAMDAVRAELARRGERVPVAVAAHAFVAGGLVSDSERDLTVGGADAVASDAFAGADYVALGHLHRPQRVGDRGRYAGAPVPLSFSEAGHTPSVAVVDVRAGAEAQVELVPCPVHRPLARLEGTLEELLGDPALTAAQDAWVDVTLTDAVRPADAMARVQKRFPHALHLRFAPTGAAADLGSYAVRLRGLDDAALVERFVADVRGEDPTPEELAVLQDALAAGRRDEVAA
ncbi:MAG TPA: exonuclease SbcCD subunit D C-terminal domain-containing protein [Baekduia sp.]|nr:exonuclease SbcCD subunit D C-terminal domain-containing protein [Baekduia sp.]